MAWGTHCPNCDRKYPNGYVEAKERERGEKIKAALAKAERVGRPREVSYDEIYKMRDQGHSVQRIADKIGMSRGSVQHALRIRNA